MSNFSINLDINVDINKLLDQVGRLFNTTISRNGITSSSPKGYDKFVSVLNDNQVVSCYFHPYSRHKATANGKTHCESIANPGEWAVAYSIRGLFGNKTFYDTL